MTMIERVGWAIANVALWSRFNDWTSDRVEGFPIEICRYGNDDEPEIVVVRRFPRDIGEMEALTMTVMEERARAAIEAMREPSEAMVSSQGKSRPDLAPTERARALAERLNASIRLQAVRTYREMIDAALQEGNGTVET
ncbi:hypothetical protein [Rhizobium sp. AG207R]|uniref:hypothetical protein n=1 Tax=Rhizobium sp. AG207R TaxID=2802287 RepID=UPI0022ABDE38|nr:hypothetical protein [Rhizobium sp. AG207R]MCZ3377407.1 hypothetical protein [Rhizobium sp. AG207R]